MAHALAHLIPQLFIASPCSVRGAITNRIDRVEREGLVKPLPDPKDRRGTLVRLTANGRKLADHAIALHFEALVDALSDMKRGDRQQLAALLAKLLSAVEQRRDRGTRE